MYVRRSGAGPSSNDKVPTQDTSNSQQEAVVGTPESFDIEVPRRKPTVREAISIAFILAGVICGAYELLSASFFGHLHFSPHLYEGFPVVSMSYHPDWFAEGIVV